MPMAFRRIVPSAVRTGAWYARYICELPSMRYRIGLADIWEAKFLLYHWDCMRIGAAMALVAVLTLSGVACSRSEFFRQYEYEEGVYLSLDGSATVYVNSSVAALDVLRGAAFDTSTNATIDRDAVRAWFTTPVTTVTRRPTLSRRGGRRFAHVRLDVDDVKTLSQAPPLAWSTYTFAKDGDVFAYKQVVGQPVGKPVGEVGWTGDEIVAFRLHLPSDVVDTNASAENHKRGNILVWEQSLRDRLSGQPLTLEARIGSESILTRTLLLFGGTAVAVIMSFGFVLWLVMRRGPGRASF